MLHRLPPTNPGQRPTLNEIQPDLHPLEVFYDVEKLLNVCSKPDSERNLDETPFIGSANWYGVQQNHSGHWRTGSLGGSSAHTSPRGGIMGTTCRSIDCMESCRYETITINPFPCCYVSFQGAINSRQSKRT